MKIHYDYSSKSWYHHEKKKVLFMGSKQTEIQYYEQEQSGTGLSFSIKPFHKSKGIAVGILTCRTEKNISGIGGNLSLFQELHLYLAQHGIFSYIFTAEDALKEKVSGYIFSPQLSEWKKVTVPAPDVVYNRIPLRSYEAGQEFRQLKSLLHRENIPLFNRRFLNKYEIHQVFNADEFLKMLLPETMLLSSSTGFYSFLEKHENVYVKPVTGNRGSGIYHLTLKHDQTLEAATPQKKQKFNSFTHFWEHESKKFVQHKYIIQKAIVPKKVDGHRYDYRILVHFVKGTYTLSGKAVRMSQTQEITTHIPKGGKLYPYDGIRTEELDDLLSKISQRCGIVLSEAFGFFGEFSIDLGEDEDGLLYIFEINSKPMQFDEEEIEKQRRQHLKNLFIELAAPAKQKWLPQL